MSVPWDLISLGADVAIVMIFYSAYKSSCKLADLVKAAPFLQSAGELRAALDNAPDSTLGYAGIEGCVMGLEPPLQSRFSDVKGVIQNLSMVEHKSKRTQGYWTDMTKTIRDTTNTIPFCLRVKADGKEDVGVRVTEPLEADMLMESLHVSYDHYEPAKSGMLERGLDRLFGEVTKGFQEREQMLELGANVVGIGKLVMDTKGVSLLPPDSSDVGRYILTKLSKHEIMKRLEGNAKFWKILSVIFGITGMGILAYILYKRYRDWSQVAEHEAMTEEIRRRRIERLQQHRNEDTGENQENAEQNCVICLSNPREIVLLECGHICLCAECLDQLPLPRKCPVCRANVSRAIPTYNP